MTTNDAAPAPDTVEQIMALADEFAEEKASICDLDVRDKRYWPQVEQTKESRAALRAAVERVVRERDDLALELHEERANSGRVHDALSRAEREAAENKARLLEAKQDIRDLLALKTRTEKIEREAAEYKRDAERLNFIEANHYEVSSEPDDCETKWVVFRVTGWPNDREWHTIGKGESLRAAIDAAMKEGK